MAENQGRLYIVRIVIDGLFGQYSYDLAPKADANSLSQLFILYGENGSGKTTILWLLNHLLSKENEEGHRSFLARTQFAKISVHMSDGTTLSAVRAQSTTGNFTMTMTRGKTKSKYDYVVDEDGDISIDVARESKHEAFRQNLPDLKLIVLADDRKVSTATVLRKSLHARRDLRSALESVDRAEKSPSALEPALGALREWARSRALEGSNVGQRDVNVIYIDLLKRLSRTNEHQEPLSKLIEKLTTQGKRSALFSRFGLSSEVEVDSIIKVISESTLPRRSIMAQVIKPYMDSNEARFDALDSLQRTLGTFVDELNTRFFKNKTISFDLGRGVRISSGDQPLNPKVLSSGEKQLLVLFCNVVQASNRRSIFIIDEPELSLNVDWQRHLIDALQRLGSDNVQLIFATHSLELLSRHRDNVAKLEGEKTAQVVSVADRVRLRG